MKSARKGSKNREKARRKVARLHARIAGRRRDFQHGRILQTHPPGTCVVRALVVGGKASGSRITIWPKRSPMWAHGELIRILSYKAAWYERTVVAIDRFFREFQTMCGL